MSKKKFNTILNEEGYLVKKSDFTKSQLSKIKDELTVTPKTMDNNSDDLSFPVFTETSEYLSVPRFYGNKKFGLPKENKLIDTPIDIKFNGNLREYQINLVNLCLDKLKTDGGGLLCVGCGQGEY